MLKRFCPACGKLLTMNEYSTKCNRCLKQITEKKGSKPVGFMNAARAYLKWKYVLTPNPLQRVRTAISKIPVCPICGKDPTLCVSDNIYIVECSNLHCPIAPTSKGETFIEAKWKWLTKRWDDTKQWREM